MSYSQTTRYFDQVAAEKIIKFVNESDKDILIYHGGLWTIGTYFHGDIEMEKLEYPYKGSGVADIPVPHFVDKNIHVVCTEHENGDICFNKIINYFSTNNVNEVYLAAIHVREYQYQPYVVGLESIFKNKKVIISSDETKLVSFSK